MSEKFTKFLIPLSIIIAGLFIAGVFIYVNQGKELFSKKGLSAQEVAEKAINFINENFDAGGTASLIDVSEAGSVYKIRLKIGETEYESYATKDGEFLFPEGYKLEEIPETQSKTQEEENYTIGNFLVSKDEICREDEKPIIYFFGSQSCPHCTWEHPIVEKAAKNFEGYIAFHNNMDSNVDMDVFYEYSSGGIPTLVLGCKYYRVGSGEKAGEESESNTLTALICKLTGNQPSDVCNPLQDLINQIE